jgi:cystathionine beta-lyase family protein involved in aluminum resistance
VNRDEIIKKSDEELAEIYAGIDAISLFNTRKVLDSFRSHRVSEAMFAPSTGYGYGDTGRDTLDLIYADVFGTEKAFVRHNIVNGTHALTIALFGLLRPGDTLLSVTGKPYDTLDEVIGLSGKAGAGSLRDFGVAYRQTEMADIESGAFIAAVDTSTKAVFIQRSKGYMNRRTLSAREINDIVKRVKSVSDAYVIVDNCYGEFVETEEPSAADLIVGSLIKNPGGGVAESGAYVAGTAEAVELASYRLTTPGIGLEVGASLGHNKEIFKGLFLAPHVVAQAVKTAVFAAYVFGALGYEVEPRWNDFRGDIIQTIKFGDPTKLISFIRSIQKYSAVDSHVVPEPWDMPGYADKVIMASGSFTQGSSIELSADAPIRPPFTAFLQGALTYEAGRMAIAEAMDAGDAGDAGMRSL